MDKNKPEEKVKWLGIASIAVAGLAFLTSWIPFVNNGSAMIAILSLVMALVALFLNLKNKKLLSLIGIGISVLSICIVLLTQTMYSDSYETTTTTTTSSTENHAEPKTKSKKKVPSEYTAALDAAYSYSKNDHLSKQYIFEELTNPDGNKFEKKAAQYAVDNVKADWNYNAKRMAETASRNDHLSKQAIYEVLVDPDNGNGKFTKSEAQYAIKNMKANFNDNALKTAKNMQRDDHLSKQEIYENLVDPDNGNGKFTEAEAKYAINNLDK